MKNLVRARESVGDEHPKKKRKTAAYELESPPKTPEECAMERYQTEQEYIRDNPCMEWAHLPKEYQAQYYPQYPNQSETVRFTRTPIPYDDGTTSCKDWQAVPLPDSYIAVSYTHLTLPTICSV